MKTLTLGRSGVEVRVSSHLPPGVMVKFGGALHVRHMSEFYLFLRGASWHPQQTGCPTWDDATECRCMSEETHP